MRPKKTVRFTGLDARSPASAFRFHHNGASDVAIARASIAHDPANGAKYDLREGRALLILSQAGIEMLGHHPGIYVVSTRELGQHKGSKWLLEAFGMRFAGQAIEKNGVQLLQCRPSQGTVPHPLRKPPENHAASQFGIRVGQASGQRDSEGVALRIFDYEFGLAQFQQT